MTPWAYETRPRKPDRSPGALRRTLGGMSQGDGTGPDAEAAEPRWWPDECRASGSGVTIGTVSYNTCDLVAFLLWSIYRHVRREVLHVVVVDNSSTDGSQELLAACAEAGLCDLIANSVNRYHGPGLNQVVSYLAERQNLGDGVGWLWLLDSDCVIARADAITGAISHARRTDAVLVGEPRWDPWHDEMRLGTFSLMFDPSGVWRPPTSAFVDDGDPARGFELSCRRQDLSIAEFPFTVDGYVIHRGRGTLANVRQRAEVSNRFHGWAAEHHEAHYEGVMDAGARYRTLWSEFIETVGKISPKRLVDALVG